MAEFMTIRRKFGIAGQVRYTVTRDTEHGPHKSAFVGTLHGTPGPVVCVLMDGVQFFVDSPERFGPLFNRSWVENFYTP